MAAASSPLAPANPELENALGDIEKGVESFKTETDKKTSQLVASTISSIERFNHELQQVVLDTDAQKFQSSRNSVKRESYKKLLERWVSLIDKCEQIDKTCRTIFSTVYENSPDRLDVESLNSQLQYDFNESCKHSLRGLHHRFRTDKRIPQVSTASYLFKKVNMFYSQVKRYVTINEKIREQTRMILNSLQQNNKEDDSKSADAAAPAKEKTT